MDTNEIITNDEVIEVTEEIANAGSGKGFKVAAVVGFGILACVIACKYFVKPSIAKIKAVIEQQRIDKNFEPIDIVDVEESEETT